MSALRPCFACGESAVAGPADIGEAAREWVITCPHCGATTESFGEIEAAAARWNSLPGCEPALGGGGPAGGAGLAGARAKS
jgi:hypothetical protein